MGDGELEVLEGEAQDVVQPLLAITRKSRSHTDVHSAKSRRLSTPQPIKTRSADHAPPIKNPSIRKKLLKKSKSAPDLSITPSEYIDRHPEARSSFQASSEEAGDLAMTSDRLLPFAEYSDNSSLNNIAVSRAVNTACRKAILGQIFECSQPTHAEALWDHTTLDALELRFCAGDVIEVMDMLDKDWWWGKIKDREGWFPAAFVTLRKRQSFEFSEGILETNEELTLSNHSRHESMQRKSEARSSVIQDLLTSERDYVKHLKDVVEGYVERARKYVQMFSSERISTIFGNIEQIYQFASTFLKDLERCINAQEMSASEIGNCILSHESGFQIYSEYCNNHPFACEELHRLQMDQKYLHFFEACRLLQQMIEIPLEGFLLTPVQKICKYPLQLKELLKYTHSDHPDRLNLVKALEMMKKTAVLINERKRKMESLEKLAHWQTTVACWQGPSLLEHSSELIHSGELNKVSVTGSQRLRFVFLFDHQLVFCKKDILWREMYTYKGRIFLDNTSLHRIQDCKVSDGASLKHGFRLLDHANDSWYTFSCRTLEEEEQWLGAFLEEKQRINLDRQNGFDLIKFKDKTLVRRQILPNRVRDKYIGKKVYVAEDAASPLPRTPQPKRGFLSFMNRKHRR